MLLFKIKTLYIRDKEQILDRKLQITGKKWILMLTMVVFLSISVNIALGQEASGQMDEALAGARQGSEGGSIVIPPVWWVAPRGVGVV